MELFLREDMAADFVHKQPTGDGKEIPERQQYITLHMLYGLQGTRLNIRIIIRILIK
jgi:hypothetical protein